MEETSNTPQTIRLISRTLWSPTSGSTTLGDDMGSWTTNTFTLTEAQWEHIAPKEKWEKKSKNTFKI